MLQGTVVATVAVKDMAAAKTFYGETLGLKQIDENPGGVTYQSGDGRLFIYEAPTAGTNQATSATWEVTDVKVAAEELRQKGVSFEHYDMPGGSRDGDVHSMGGTLAAWFKDPSGNILCIVSM